jgi:ABC-type antimicrobial peptide transport system permease subunit
MTIIVKGILGIFLGLLLGLGNGIIVAIVTRLCFFPLTNPKLHRQFLTAISIELCTLTSLAFLPKTSLPYYSSSSYISVLAPSLIVGLSMGASSKYFARWYQRKSGL